MSVDNSKMTKTPSIDKHAKLPDLGSERISPERFSSPKVMQQEWDKLWRKVWNTGPRVEEFKQPGDYVLHSLGKESFIFVLDNDENIRCYYNVCQHRGNRLVVEKEGSPCHNAQFFKCAFHAWSWNIDGSIKGVPDPDSFPQFADGLPKEELGLEEVLVDQWAGWVWFNLNKNAEPLMDYLGDLPEHIGPYRLEDMRLYEHKTFLWEANWKTACDAFNESYHFRAIHPEMLSWTNDIARLELLGIHSRMINEYGTVSPSHRGEDLSQEMKNWMGFYGIDAENYSGDPKDVRIAKQKQARAIEDEVHFPYKDLTDEQLSDVYHYFFFPNIALNIFAEGINAFRYRPHETDPNKMYYDLILLAHFPKGEEPDIEYKKFDHKVTYCDIIDHPFAEIAAPILQQDADNVPYIQQGVKSDGFRGPYLGDQEIRLRHFHNTVDDYLNK